MTLALNWALALGVYFYVRTWPDWVVAPEWVENAVLVAGVIAWLRVWWLIADAIDYGEDAVIVRTLGWVLA